MTISSARLKTPNNFKPYLKYESVLTDMYNQADEIKELNHSEERGHRRNIKSVIILKNEARYLPKGWHHWVSAIGEEIIAINFWFRSVERSCILAPTLNSEFIWRYITHEKIENRVKLFLRGHYDALQARYHNSSMKNITKKIERIKKVIDSQDTIFRYLFKVPAWKIRGFLEDIRSQEELLNHFLSKLSENNIELLTS